MAAYLTRSEFALLSVMPRSDIDRLESMHPGFVDAQLDALSAYINARLAKRYAVPFGAPVPLVVRMWLTAMVSQQCFLKRGVDPTDEQYGDIRKGADDARTEIKEAADSNVGLFDLPLIETVPASGISRGGPFGYTEASPYVWTDVQSAVARGEDRAGGGSDG